MSDSCVVRSSLPFKDKTSVNVVRGQMRDLSHKIGITLQLIFVSKAKDISRQSFINNAWFNYFHVTCVIRIVLAILPEIFTSALLNT